MILKAGEQKLCINRRLPTCDLHKRIEIIQIELWTLAGSTEYYGNVAKMNKRSFPISLTHPLWMSLAGGRML